MTFSLSGYTVVAHGGGLPGFGTIVLFLPDEGYGIVTMGNTAGTSNMVGNLIALALLERKLGLSSEESAFAKAMLLARLSDSGTSQELYRKGSEDRITEQRSQRPGATQTEWLPTEMGKLPLPGDMGDFTGLYGHILRMV
jgi:hypothetical protein